jgi:hypothetical protein
MASVFTSCYHKSPGEQHDTSGSHDIPHTMGTGVRPVKSLPTMQIGASLPSPAHPSIRVGLIPIRSSALCSDRRFQCGGADHLWYGERGADSRGRGYLRFALGLCFN